MTIQILGIRKTANEMILFDASNVMNDNSNICKQFYYKSGQKMMNNHITI